MIYQACKKHLFYAAFAAILAAILLTTASTIVRSQPPVDAGRPHFKYDRINTPQTEVSNIFATPSLAGGLDTEFGKRVYDFSSSEYSEAVAVQADGKIVAAGSVSNHGNGTLHNRDFAVFRYNPDGSLDTSFGTNGKAITPLGNEGSGDYDYAYDVAIQTDGKILVVGQADWIRPSAIVRYNPDGSLDTSFGTGGIVFVDQLFSTYGALYSIAVQADGRIVAAGYAATCDKETCSIVDFILARITTTGLLDTSFDGDGILTTDFDGDYEYATDIAIQSDGKIVAVGHSYYGDVGFKVARYNVDGSLDASFDSDGKVTVGGIVPVTSVALQSDGKIVVAGYGCDGANCDFALARLNTNGSLDTTFDGDGRLTTDFGNEEGANAVAIQTNGKIVAGGSSEENFAIARYNSDGSLDTSFGIGGKVTTDFGDADRLYGLAIHTNGKIVAAGSNRVFDYHDYALARYNADGLLDTSFDSDGKVTTGIIDTFSAANAVVHSTQENVAYIAGYVNVGTNEDFAIVKLDHYGNVNIVRTTPVGGLDEQATSAAVGLSTNNTVTVAGFSNNGSNYDFALVRYFRHALDLDTRFGQGGKVTTDFGENADRVTAVAIQSDNKTVAVGHTVVGGVPVLAMARYNFDGSLDSTFGTGGKVISQSIQNPKAVVIQPDGKIIAAGDAPRTDPPFGEDFAIARFHPNGVIDTSFDGDGIATVGFDQFSSINSIALQTTGEIVAAGYTSNNGSSTFALARLQADGSLDTSFDGDGKVTTSFGTAYCEANAVRVQSNGKIVAVGTVYDEFGDFALARYTPDGLLDPTFDFDGRQTTDFFGDEDRAVASVDQFGKMIAAGIATRNGKTYFAAARYIGDLTVGGRILTPSGAGLRNAVVTIIGPFGFRATATTSTFGFYSFDNVPGPGDYTFAVASRRYRFPQRSLQIYGNDPNINLVGEE